MCYVARSYAWFWCILNLKLNSINYFSSPESSEDNDYESSPEESEDSVDDGTNLVQDNEGSEM